MSRKIIAGTALVLSLLPSQALAARGDDAFCSVSETLQTAQGRLKIVGGVEANRVWVVADHGDLQIRKFTAKGGATVIELKYHDDSVILSLSADNGSVSRNGRAVTLSAPDALDVIRELVGASPAMFHARLVLSRYEQVSDLKGPSMSVLTALAVAATFSGDVDAPARLSARFLERHRGLFRRVRDEGSCWKDYEAEVNAAAIEHEACVVEAAKGSWWLFVGRMNLCTAGWILRTESAWFELGKCNGLLTLIPKIE